MAIAFDAAAVSEEGADSTTTWSHTTGTGANRLLVVGVAVVGTDPAPDCTGVTHDGVGMTKARSDIYTIVALGLVVQTSVWILKNPTSGAKNVVASVANNISTSGCSVSYTGCSQTSTADAVNGKTGTGTGSQTFTVTTVADNSWIFAMGIGIFDTFAASATSRGTVSVYMGYGTMRGQDTNAAQTPAGAKTIGYTIGASSFGFAMTGASFAPVAEATDTFGGRGFMRGVGRGFF
jgi:hypothetical protein